MSEQPSIECIRCGKEFDSVTARTMHVIRERCPGVDGEDDAASADTVHALQEVLEGGADP